MEQILTKHGLTLRNLDTLYRKLKTIDESARKLNRNNNVIIKEAMTGYIASFGLSMIKDIYLGNLRSVGFLFSIRCILEGLAIYLFTNKGVVTELEQDMFRLQAYYIEKDIYERYKIFDMQLFDLKNITNNYQNMHKAVTSKYTITSKVVRKTLNSTVPFLGEVKSFESLIREHMSEEFLMLYKTISLFIHPYDYRFGNRNLNIGYAVSIFPILEHLFENIAPAKIGLEDEYDLTIGWNVHASQIRKLAKIQNDKIKVLSDMLFDDGFYFLEHSLLYCTQILADYLLDNAMGYVEHSTTKWKAVIENLWMLNLTITDEYFARENDLIHYHSRIKNIINLGEEVPEEHFKLAYDSYKDKYPNGCEYKIFKESFLATTGYTIDEKGETISLRKAVYNLIDELSPNINDGKLLSNIKNKPNDEVNLENKPVEIDINSFLKMKYDESQKMSHATGYLYYALPGAWDDGNVLAYLFEELFQLLLYKLLNKLESLYKDKLISKKSVNFLRNFLKQNEDYIDKKRDLYLFPRVAKTF